MVACQIMVLFGVLLSYGSQYLGTQKRDHIFLHRPHEILRPKPYMCPLKDELQHWKQAAARSGFLLLSILVGTELLFKVWGLVVMVLRGDGKVNPHNNNSMIPL